MCDDHPTFNNTGENICETVVGIWNTESLSWVSIIRFPFFFKRMCYGPFSDKYQISTIGIRPLLGLRTVVLLCHDMVITRVYLILVCVVILTWGVCTTPFFRSVFYHGYILR